MNIRILKRGKILFRSVFVFLVLTIAAFLALITFQKTEWLSPYKEESDNGKR